MEKEMKSFEANLGGITERQIRFFEDAEFFIYFRKGEFDNIGDILSFFLDFLKANPQLVIFASWAAFASWVVKHYPQLKEIAKDTTELVQKLRQNREIRKRLVIRAISSENSKNRGRLKKLEKNGWGVCRIPDKEKGRLRYFVNDKRFCLFVRHKKNDFFGIEGTNQLIVSRLKRLFEKEYGECQKHQSERLSEY